MKSCHEPFDTTGLDKASTEPTTNTANIPFIVACNKITELGIQFVPEKLCSQHCDVKSMQCAIGIAMYGQQALTAVQELIKKVQQEPDWTSFVPLHFDFHGPGWGKYCDSGVIDWIDFFEEQCKLARTRYYPDLSTNIGCLGCWLHRGQHYAAPLLMLGDAILNNTEPDFLYLSFEVSVMLGEALAYARGECIDGEDKEEEDDELDDEAS
jgi:hypothetical protein